MTGQCCKKALQDAPSPQIHSEWIGKTTCPVYIAKQEQRGTCRKVRSKINIIVTTQCCNWGIPDSP